VIAFNIPVQKNGLKAENELNVLEEEVLAAPAIEQDVCSLDNYLSQPDQGMDERIAAAREKLGKSTILLGHHYQRDEVIRFADFTGDSYKLSKVAAETEAKYLVFLCADELEKTLDNSGRYYESHGLEDAFHPQTILAYELNGQALPVCL